ncbi:MAG TPA: ATP-binding protein [Stellaceae bacterium]|jgi:PAS domain S-box-containing protein
MTAVTANQVAKHGSARGRRKAPRRLARRVQGPMPWKRLLEERGKIIDQMAAGSPLKETLTEVARMVERLAPPALCSVLLLQPDGKHLRHGAGPSLPDEYNRAIDDLEIGPSVGSCGTAAFRKRPVIVSDIATDPLWEGPREFALSFGLRACWSQPIISDAGVVLGTIAMYYREPRKPTPREFGLLQPSAGLVRLALAQHRKEEELRAAEIRNNLAVDSAGLGTFHIDMASGAVTWSDRLKAITGLAPDVTIKNGTLESLIHPDDLPVMKERYQRWVDSEIHDQRNIEYRIRRADDGAERILSLRGRVVVNAQGEPVSAIGVCADVTDQRAAERTRRETEQKIHQMQKMEALGQLAGGIAHDLNNTLMPILGLSKLGMQELPPNDPLAEHLSLIHRSGERARDLVNQILIFSRKEEIARGKVHLARVVEESVPLLRATIPAAIAFDVQIDGDPTVWANRGQIDQVLTNLVTNAAQAIGKHNGTIRIELGTDESGKMARLALIDDGPGIDPNAIQRIFEPFFTTKPVGEGTGLGLAVAHGIIASHGGRIEVASERGHGATFQVFLPLLKRRETIVAAELAAAK